MEDTGSARKKKTPPKTTKSGPSRHRLSRQDKDSIFSTSSGAFQLLELPDQTSDNELDKQDINQLGQMPFDEGRCICLRVASPVKVIRPSAFVS